MELQACEVADHIHPFIKSFGNHNTTLATSATAELAKYNIWYKKYFKESDTLNKITGPYNRGDTSAIIRKFLKTAYYPEGNAQSMTIIEMALCYGMTLDYDKMTEMSTGRGQGQEFIRQLRNLNTVCRFKVLDTAIFSIYETDIMTNDKLSVFSMNNVSDHICELLALGKSVSDRFTDILDQTIELARNPNTPVFKVMEQFAYLPHTLENDILFGACGYNKNNKDLIEKVADIRNKYSKNSQDVSDATVFRTTDDEETYNLPEQSAHDVQKMNMYG